MNENREILLSPFYCNIDTVWTPMKVKLGTDFIDVYIPEGKKTTGIYYASNLALYFFLLNSKQLTHNFNLN